ncbi:DNA-binding MarR family transcriptional regulator [Actinoplanes lutulentus]|uniref:DNA-binding MarR family transcriptional regulator n=1 Tax=Actinoplanes lutulentus TaxID=1287878 RepID=A0A327Z215_9ACTN|nr:MarR family winged helix-turn-helix transcriptional regulator [Actinoplanes lutulentus]MBB2943376.1 DNA-binding MarR family transcriptional regulator [Actinoplanes lutulentus]RAK28434.1 DNA-binding MarR family transcriptional regulator [Actinoplanes lutulentus]
MSAGELPDYQGPAADIPVPVSAAAGPVSHAIFRVARLHKMHVGQLLRRVGLHPGQELVMMQLWDKGPQRQADLVRLLDSDAATMTRTVQRLEHAGFVRRSPCASDKRVTIVEPTAASLALRREVENIWTELEDRTFGEQSAAERAEALRVLERIEDNLARAATQKD